MEVWVIDKNRKGDYFLQWIPDRRLTRNAGLSGGAGFQNLPAVRPGG